MRRLALSLVALCGLAAMAACSGGTGLSNNATNVTPTTIFFVGSSGQVNDFFLSPTGAAPVSVTAYAANGSGAGSTILPNATFNWAVTYAPAGTTYVKGGSPNGNGTCGSPAQKPGINSLLQQLGNGNPFPLYPGYSQLSEKANSNPPQYTQSAQQIFVGPPTIPPPPPADPDTATLSVVPYATGSTNYCLVVYATYVPNNLTRGVIVVVSDSP
jgi:hypothetical protein